jgi:GNAT superfamily N-acetyltransferase
MPVLDSPKIPHASADTVAAALALVEAEWRANPALPFPGVDPARQLAVLLARARRALEHPDAVRITVENSGRTDGIACWSPLPWDSRMYGFPAARLDLAVAVDSASRRELVAQLLVSAAGRGIRHMIARIDAGDIALAGTLAHAGFTLIDGIQTFSLSLPAAAPAPLGDGVRTRLFQPDDLDQILALARTAYVFDRFHADDAIDGPTADRMNEEWVRNSCSGHAADAVLVAVSGSEVLSYVTCRMDRDCLPALGFSVGTIVLVATAARARRQGAASACTRAAIEWFQSQGAGVVQVGTQLRNIPAARLYERCGFRIAANSLTWRILL